MRLIRGIGGHVIIVPLVAIILNSKFGSGKFLVGLIDTLHDSSFDGLIGNDLDPLPELEDFKVVPVGALTRAQAAALQQHPFTSDDPNSVIGDKDSCASSLKPTKVASSIESTSLMSSTKLNRNHDLDETDLVISNLFIEYPELGNADFLLLFTTDKISRQCNIMTQVWITCSLWLSQSQMMRIVILHFFFKMMFL